MRKAQSIFISAILTCLVFSMPGYAYDAKQTHPDMTNEAIELYIRLFGTKLSNGMDLETKISGEIVTDDGRVFNLSLPIREWIVLGSAEEDWGGTRKDAHFYDPQNATRGRAVYPAGAAAWLHDATNQAGQYVAVSGQAYASGDYSYEKFRELFFNSPNDARAYRALGHLLHVLQDMASPVHVRGGSDNAMKVYEGVIAALYGNGVLEQLYLGQSPVRDSAYYLARNRTNLGLTALSISDIPNKLNVEDYVTELATYANQNFFAPGDIYSGAYALPSAPAVPPAASNYAEGEFRLGDGALVPGYLKSSNFIFSRSMIKNKSGIWNGRVVISTAVCSSYYQQLAVKSIIYSVGLMRTASAPTYLPQVQVVTPSGTTTGNVAISFKLRDFNFSQVSLKLYFSEDGGATFVEGTIGAGGVGSSPISATPDWADYVVYWNSDADIGGTDQDDIRVKIVPTGKYVGVGQSTSNFTLQNYNRPPKVAVTTPTGQYVRYVTLSYVLYDIDSNLSNIKAYYSVDGGTTFNLATMGAGGDGDANLTSLPTGVSHTYAWDSLSDVGSVDLDGIVIKILPSDASGTGLSGQTDSTVAVRNQYPVCVIGVPATPLRGDVTFSYTLSDAVGSPVDIAAEYSIDGGATFSPASMGPGGDGLTALATTPSGVGHTYVWRSYLDIGLNQYDSVVFRLTPTNARGTGSTSATDVLEADNFPQVEFVSPGAGETETGEVLLSYKLLTPGDVSNVDVAVEYTVDGGNNFYACTSVGYGNGITGLNGSTAGVTYYFSWDTLTDFVTNQGGIAAQNFDAVSVRITEVSTSAVALSNGFKVYNKGLSETAPWPKQFGYSLENQQKSRYNGPASPTLRWTGPLRTQDWVTPVVSEDGTIYIAGCNVAGQYGLFALNPEDGSLKWFFRGYDEWPRSTPAIGRDGRIYYPTRISGYSGSEYQLMCLTDDGNQATVNWAFDTRYFYYQVSPTLDTDGTIYVPCQNASGYYGVKAITDLGSSAEEKWFYYHVSYTAYPKTTPSIYEAGNTITFGDHNYYVVYGVNRTSGVQSWFQSFSYNYKGTPIIYNNKIYMTDGYYQRRLNVSTGANEWSPNAPCCTDSFAYMTPSISYGDFIMFNFYSNYRYIYAYNESLTLMWTYNDPNSQYPRNYFANCPDNTFFIRCGNYLRKIDGTNGTLVAGWNAVNLVQARYFTGLAIGADENIYSPGQDNADSFRCYGDNKPVVQSLAPSSISNEAQVSLKIYGGGFTTAAGGGGGATEVKLKKGVDEQVLAIYTVENYSRIYATVPSGLAAGEWDVIITTPNGANVASNAKLTITAP